MRSIVRVHWTALAGVLVLACGGASSPGAAAPESSPSAQPSAPPGAQPSPSGQPATTSTILVSFKLDPRLQGGTYGGEIWVSPPAYVGIQGQHTVDARAAIVDADGGLTSISPDWTPSDPGMISVSPTLGAQVAIDVRQAGESTLTVTVGGLSKTLRITATAQAGRVVQVEISQ
jgi:hypothetical protein